MGTVPYSYHESRERERRGGYFKNKTQLLYRAYIYTYMYMYKQISAPCKSLAASLIIIRS